MFDRLHEDKPVKRRILKLFFVLLHDGPLGGIFALPENGADIVGGADLVKPPHVRDRTGFLRREFAAGDRLAAGGQFLREHFGEAFRFQISEFLDVNHMG